MSCTSDPCKPGRRRARRDPTATRRYAWTDLTYLLHAHHVSWGYYVAAGTQPDCDDGADRLPATPAERERTRIWNPLPHFTDVHQDGQLRNIQDAKRYFFSRRAGGTLPSVSWVVPNQRTSASTPARSSAPARPG